MLLKPPCIAHAYIKAWFLRTPGMPRDRKLSLSSCWSPLQRQWRALQAVGPWQERGVCVCVSISVRTRCVVCTGRYIYVISWIYVFIYIHLYIHMYVCIYQIYVCKFLYLLSIYLVMTGGSATPSKPSLKTFDLADSFRVPP